MTSPSPQPDLERDFAELCAVLGITPADLEPELPELVNPRRVVGWDGKPEKVAAW